MAEILGIASSITTLIENTVTVIKYLKDVKNAPKERDELQRELQYLEVCLTALERTTQLSTKDDPWLQTLEQLRNGAFQEFLELLKGLKTRLKAGSTQFKRILRRMDWTMTKEGVMEDLGKIERFKSLIVIAGQHDNLALTREIKKSLGDIEVKVDAIAENADATRQHSDVTRQLQMDAKAKEVAAWLTPVDYNAVQRDKLQQRVDETGQWFLRSPEFLDWVDSSVARPLLWCAGGPGVGKTMLASTTVNHLRMKFDDNKTDKALIFCIFCDYRAMDQKTITIIRSLLKQLIQARCCLTAPLETFYNKWSHGGMSPSLAEITSLFSAELKSYDCIYIILDGLDELDDNRCREEVLHALKALGDQIHVLVTSRPLDNMQSFTEAHKFEIRACDADLEKCVIAGLKVGHLPALLSKDGSLGEKICQTVVKKADGMFLLANIHMNLLAQCTNRWQLNTELDKLPGTLQKAYEYLLDRINSLPSRDLAYRIFGLVAFAARPLFVEVLQQALAIESGTKKADPANITDEGILLSICVGLVVIVDINCQRCFKFVHYSTQEYFVSQEDKLFPHIHVDFTRICLAHMSFNIPDDSNIEFVLFSWYSMRYWDFHAHKCSGISTAKEILAFLDDKPTQMEDIAQPFQEQKFGPHDLTLFPGMVHAVKLLLAAPEVKFQHLHGLCLAAYVGNYNVVNLLQSSALDIDCKGQVPFLHEVPSTSLSPAQKDSSGCRGSRAPLCTPLIAAASNGYEETVERLLNPVRGNRPLLNAMSSSGLTALCSAIICNSIPVVTLLLKECNIDTSIQFKGQTPFMLAARYGFTEIMVLFLERQDDDPNTPGENGRTALHAAIEESQHGSIDLLLKSGRVDVNRKDSEGRTALSIAASLGSVQSVKMLVDHVGIDVSVKDNDGKSAYDIVVEGGQHEVVTLLTEYAVKGPGTK
ncbi:hypothetical protein IW261DRAFT_1610544 [Armillaria novae-zelandiae]|uniref:NACHT domain-containing protein n=1 Tax=Armillaria novae-zelandiae TaxID=153914 RepID=A0AA39NYR9_9AGAR|nr:hypothetical protein IW261DRAFT_1610544 [Armillaria novae-zelandiae]